LEYFTILPKNQFEEVGSKGIESCRYPSITDWIQSYKGAKFIITDSFHGVVLSIIFNKEFVCIGNRSRGLTRMTNILGKFNLLDRLILDGDNSSEFLKFEKIDYEKVNRLLDIEKLKALSFLRSSLIKQEF